MANLYINQTLQKHHIIVVSEFMKKILKKIIKLEVELKIIINK